LDVPLDGVFATASFDVALFDKVGFEEAFGEQKNGSVAESLSSSSFWPATMEVAGFD